MAAQTVSDAVAKRDAGPITIIWSRKKHFDAVLPASVDVEAFLGTAAGALYASPKLMEYATANPDSLVIALMECAALGHMPGTDEYYLTPRKDHGKPKVLGIEGYRGVIERMYRSGAVARVIVREVCANDPFGYVEGVDRVPRHEIGGRGETGGAFFSAQRGEMVGAYAYAELGGGAISRVVILTRDDILAARDSGGYTGPDDQYSPWNRLDSGKDHPEFRGRSMWWKTGAKRLEPWVPTSAEYRAEMLRASASAAALAEPRRRELAAPEGTALSAGEIVDAELVDEPADPTSTGAADADPTAAPVAAPADPARSQPVKGPDLGLAFRRLGIEEADQPAVLKWLMPRWTATAKQIADLTGKLTEYSQAGENPDEARNLFWQAFHQANGKPDA